MKTILIGETDWLIQIQIKNQNMTQDQGNDKLTIH